MRFGGMTMVAVLALGACTSETTPREPNTSATTTAPSATPTAAAPTMPEQAREDSPEGAAAFVKHYIDVLNYAASTGEVDELSRLSSPSCKGCQNYIKLYRDTYAAGGYFKGGEWKLGELVLEFDDDETFATTNVATSATRFLRNRGAQEEAGASEKNKITVAMVTSGTSRKVSQLALGGAQ